MKKVMKKIILILAAVALTGCGIYKPYNRPEVKTDGLYGAGVETADSTTLGDVAWQEIFTDPCLQRLIEKGLESNVDMLSAHLKVEQAEASLKSARLAYIPSLNFAPQGSISRPITKSFSVPVTASWQIDIFNSLTNAKRKARALHAQSQEYVQAVRTQLISGIANLYYSLLMLDSQYHITELTAKKWAESVETMRAMKEAGMTNEAAVAQYEGNYYSILSSLRDIDLSRRELENSLCSLLGEIPHEIERGTLESQQLPEHLMVGVPVQMLANRPDIRMAEYSLMQAYYATAEARSACYPSLSLSGTAGWTYNSAAISNPGSLILSAVAQLVQPIFNAGANRARVKIMKSQQEEARLGFQQALLDAGAEVNNALAQTQTARAKGELRANQIEAMERAVESTMLLMRHGSTTYLDVLTAEQSLLSARLAQTSDRFDEIQGIVNLYKSLGGGRELGGGSTITK